MKKNIGKADRLIRVTIAAFLVLMILSNNVLGVWAYASSIVAVLLFLTAVYGISPTYSILNVSSLKKK